MTVDNSILYLSNFRLRVRAAAWWRWRGVLQADRHRVPALLRQQLPQPGLHHPRQDSHPGVQGQEPRQQGGE